MRVKKSRFALRFFLHQVVWLAAAMLVGWLGLALFPDFLQACTQAVGSGWRSLGLGLGVLAGIPVAIIVVAITLVGIPISLMLLAVYLAAIYLAKLWVGAFLGRILLKPAGATKTRLAAGIAGGPVDPHHRRVHSIFWWPGSLDCSLPGIGSVRLPAAIRVRDRS